jgi:hypothetical protein
VGDLVSDPPLTQKRAGGGHVSLRPVRQLETERGQQRERGETGRHEKRRDTHAKHIALGH